MDSASGATRGSGQSDPKPMFSCVMLRGGEVGDRQQPCGERQRSEQVEGAEGLRLGDPAHEPELRARDGLRRRAAQAEVRPEAEEADEERGRKEGAGRQRTLVVGAGQEDRRIESRQHAERVEDAEED